MAVPNEILGNYNFKAEKLSKLKLNPKAEQRIDNSTMLNSNSASWIIWSNKSWKMSLKLSMTDIWKPIFSLENSNINSKLICRQGLKAKKMNYYSLSKNKSKNDFSDANSFNMTKIKFQ